MATSIHNYLGQALSKLYESTGTRLTHTNSSKNITRVIVESKQFVKQL